MAPRKLWLIGILVPFEIAIALLVVGLPTHLIAPDPQTYAARPGLVSTPTSTSAHPVIDVPQPETIPTPTPLSPSPTPTPEERSSNPTATAAPTDTPTPSLSATPAPSSTVVLSPTTSLSTTPISALATASATPLPSFVVANTQGDGVNLRRSPSTSSMRLRTIPEGGVVVATGPSVSSEGAVWYPVRDSRGVSGWVQARYLTVLPAQS